MLGTTRLTNLNPIFRVSLFFSSKRPWVLYLILSDHLRSTFVPFYYEVYKTCASGSFATYGTVQMCLIG